MRSSRRSFLTGVAGAGVAGVVANSGPAAASAADRVIPFHGVHQAGIVTPVQRAAAFAVFDVVAANRRELSDLLQAITARARFLTAGGTPADPGITAPPNDSGVLGRTVPADGLTVTAGFGDSLFDGRYGLSDRKPAQLKRMRTFPNDDLDPACSHGDLSLQLCADNTDTVLHALRDITRHTRGGMQIRYRMDGFASPPRPSGTSRNQMGFKDGTSNVDLENSGQQRKLVWAGPGEPGWAVGGSYQVIRLIRMRVEFWDRVSLSEQENMFGRRRDTGAPLDGIREHDQPDYARDPTGEVIPLTSHMRLANPRTPQTADSFLLRRPYNYDNGTDAVGDLDMGMIFVAYQQDVIRQFETVQERLIDEPLTDYITPYGGGYFFTPPGIRDSSDHLGRALLT